MAPSGRPILVTGSHRSGSTWVGRMLTLAPGTGYIHEPFNPITAPGVCALDFPYWFVHVHPGNEDRFVQPLRQTLQFSYGHLTHLAQVRSLMELKRYLAEAARFKRNRLRRARPVVKDPIALMSAEWLSRTFDMEVVVLIRHPAAFVGSLKRAEWHFPFDHLARQEVLMNGLLAPYARKIREFAQESQPLTDQAILLWNLIHHVILGYQKRHPEWHFVRHEDLSLDPVPEFRRLFEAMDLPFTDRVRERIARHSLGKRKGTAGLHDIRRDSRSNVWSWRKRLDAAEIAKIHQGTRHVARYFYADTDW